MIVLTFFILGLGVMKATEILQEVIPWKSSMWFVSLESVGLAVLAVFLLGPDLKTKEQILWAFGVAGLAAVLHSAENFLRAAAHRSNAEWVSRHDKPRRNQVW